MASTTRALIVSLKRLQPPPPSLPPAYQPHYFSSRRLLSFPYPTTPTITTLSTRLGTKRSSGIVNCLVSGVDNGGGASDTRRLEFSREFAVIANMLKRIEPLDKSDISSGISDSAKESMKQTLSTMLGLLPSDQFTVSVRVSKIPLHRLLVSSIITGYTLWNAEYRLSLARNFGLSMDDVTSSNNLEDSKDSEMRSIERNSGGGDIGVDACADVLDLFDSHNRKCLSSEASNYIEKLESELCVAMKELDDQKQESVQTRSKGGNDNHLLEYLRSLESEMVSELSRPSSLEVKEVIHQLAENILQRFFEAEADAAAELEGERANGSTVNQENFGAHRETIGISRDYLAKLLFWCMLLGHHLRGLEYRLHLSCVVGVL